MSSNIWNLTHPLRVGYIKLAPGGRELYGTVVRQGRMQKTATVRISSYHWNFKVGFWLTRTKNFHCHDEEDYCRVGDKVVIQQCRKMSRIKSYMVRNIILPAPRQNFYTKDMSKYEVDAIAYNTKLRSQPPPQSWSRKD